MFSWSDAPAGHLPRDSFDERSRLNATRYGVLAIFLRPIDRPAAMLVRVYGR
jgi:hypothetical protein